MVRTDLEEAITDLKNQLSRAQATVQAVAGAIQFAELLLNKHFTETPVIEVQDDTPSQKG